MKLKKPKKIRIKKAKFKKPKSTISGLANKARQYIMAARSPKSFLSRVLTDTFKGLTKMSSDYLAPMAIYKTMLKRYNHEWIELLPGAFREEQYGNHVDKVLAVKSLLRNDLYFKDPFVFEKVTLALNDIPISNDAYQELLPDQIAYSLIQAHIFRDKVVMSGDVEVYIVMHLLDCGFPILLWPFDIENDSVPKDVVVITERVKEWLGSPEEELDEDLHLYVEKYFDMLDILMSHLDRDGASLDALGFRRR